MEEVPNKEYTISKAKGVSIAYNMIAFIFLAFIAVNNTKFLLIFLVLYVLLGIVLILFSNGSIKFVSNSKDSKAGFTIMGIFLSGIVLFFKSLNYTLISYNNLWLPFFIFSAVLFTLICIRGINKDLDSVAGQIIAMIVISLILGFGITRQVNCGFDNSTPQLIHAVINSKAIEQGRSAHYYFELKSWDADPKTKDIEVSSSTYDNHSIGNTIDVALKSGFLHIPWYYVTQ